MKGNQLGFAIVAVIALGACGEDRRPPSECGMPNEIWKPLKSPEFVIRQAVFLNEDLYLANGIWGVSVQQPAFCGAWSNLGLRFRQWQFSDDGSLGVQAILPADAVLLAGIRSLRPDTTTLFRRSLIGDGPWIASDAGIDRNVLAIAESGASTYVAGDFHGIYLSEDLGLSWRQVARILVWTVLFSTTEDHLFAGGKQADLDMDPYLSHSVDGGRTWVEIDLTGKLLPGRQEGMTSLTTRVRDGLEIVMAASGFVYVSRDLGGSFSPVLGLRTEGHLLLNPGPPFDCVVLADSLYHTTSFEEPWQVVPLPGQGGKGGVVDWESRNLVVIARQGQDDEVFSANLDDLLNRTASALTDHRFE